MRSLTRTSRGPYITAPRISDLPLLRLRVSCFPSLIFISRARRELFGDAASGATFSVKDASSLPNGIRSVLALQIDVSGGRGAAELL
jgi:hypothetical protein